MMSKTTSKSVPILDNVFDILFHVIFYEIFNLPFDDLFHLVLDMVFKIKFFNRQTLLKYDKNWL